MNMLNQQRDYVLRTVEERGVRLIRLWFTDVLGNLKSFAISPAELENALEDGMTFDGSSIDGFSRVQESDVLAIPDPNTFVMLPWADNKAPEARVFCDIYNLDGSPFGGDPRQVLRRNLQRAQAMGLDFLIAPDMEFFYFAPPENGQPPKPLDEASFFDLTTTDVTGTLRKETIRTLETMSIPVEYSFHEDAPSQHEIDLRHTDALTMADSVMTFRLVVKEVAAAQGVHATFMPKPIVGDNGSGMHVHQSLSKDGVNLFAGDKYAGLSDIALYYIGGIIKHAKSLNAFTNPGTNSYKRLIPGFEAPVMLAYSARNRSASIRIPFSNSPKGKRIEARFPDPIANPYLAFAAQLMAGLDGVQNKIHPGDASDKDLYDLPPEEAAAIPQVCGSLREALENLDADREYLIQGGVFTNDMIDAYIDLKMAEVHRVEHTTHPVELDLYFSV